MLSSAWLTMSFMAGSWLRRIDVSRVASESTRSSSSSRGWESLMSSAVTASRPLIDSPVRDGDPAGVGAGGLEHVDAGVVAVVAMHLDVVESVGEVEPGTEVGAGALHDDDLDGVVAVGGAQGDVEADDHLGTGRVEAGRAVQGDGGDRP